MATATGTEQGKTSFVEEFLNDHEDADVATINAAWQSFGREGTISGSLISKIRRSLGLTKTRGGKKARPADVTPEVTSSKVARKAGKKTATNKRGTSIPDGTPNGAILQSSSTDRSRVGDRNEMLIALEKDFDRLLFNVIELDGMTEVEEHIRSARRVVSREIR
jgi:hypothetical protein